MNNHWSFSSYDFKILFLPAGPVVVSLPLLLIALSKPAFWNIAMLVAIWLFYIIFVFWKKIKPRYAWYMLRNLLVGRYRKPKNTNNPFEF